MVKIKEIKKIKEDAFRDIARVNNFKSLESAEIKYLGRKQGRLTTILKTLENLPAVERKQIGRLANEVKDELQKKFSKRREEITAQEALAKSKPVDITAPGIKPESGSLHPLTMAQRELERIFANLGFVSVDGPEIETDYYNFEALNIPKGHPARDMWDTFYVKSQLKADQPAVDEELVLRTHTSPVQVRIMEKYEPPFAVIVPGRAFRHEATDARHEHTFYQLEGLLVGDNISVANLKYILQVSLSEFFSVEGGPSSGGSLKMQLRPSYFPFVEPGFEVAVECAICRGGGCPTCTGGWLELLGAGMVHPKVFDYAGYPAGKYTGFAFGMGIDRLAMIKYGISDIRYFAQGDYKFLRQ